MTDSSNDVAKVAELISGARIALVTTLALDGRLVSRPLAIQEREFDGSLWFFTNDPSNKTQQVQSNDHVNVAIQLKSGYLSIAGTGSVSRDRRIIDELWNVHAEAWFENGKDDPGVALLKVDADSAEYWTDDSPRVVSVFKYAKAIATGTRPDVGDNAAVQL